MIRTLKSPKIQLNKKFTVRNKIFIITIDELGETQEDITPVTLNNQNENNIDTTNETKLFTPVPQTQALTIINTRRPCYNYRDNKKNHKIFVKISISFFSNDNFKFIYIKNNSELPYNIKKSLVKLRIFFILRSYQFD